MLFERIVATATQPTLSATPATSAPGDCWQGEGGGRVDIDYVAGTEVGLRVDVIVQDGGGVSRVLALPAPDGVAGITRTADAGLLVPAALSGRHSVVVPLPCRVAAIAVSAFGALGGAPGSATATLVALLGTGSPG